MSFYKIVKSGLIEEVYKYEKKPIVTDPRKRGFRQRYSRSTRRTDVSLERSKKALKRLIWANLARESPPAFLTLTMHRVVRTELAISCFKTYMADLRRCFGKQLAYVSVLEYQERGAVHFHILVWGLPDKVIYDEAPFETWLDRAFKRPKLVSRYFEWCKEKGFDPANARGTRFLQNIWALGYVDCVPTDGSPAIAGYLSKYLLKSMRVGDTTRRKAYWCSTNLLRPVSENSDSGFTESQFDSQKIGGVDRRLIFEREFDTLFLGRASYSMYSTNPQYGN